MSKETFAVTIDVRSPRRRGKNPYPTVARIQHELPSLTDVEAPVVARFGEEMLDEHRDGRDRLQYCRDGREVRYDGTHFYALTAISAGMPRPPRSEDVYVASESDPDKAAAEARKEYGPYVVINGEQWMRVSEPVYVIHTYGQGADFGGTDLKVAYLNDARTLAPASHVYSLHERDMAAARAMEVANDRGHHNSAARIEYTVPPADIINPGAFTASFAEARSGATDTLSTGGPAEELALDFQRSMQALYDLGLDGIR